MTTNKRLTTGTVFTKKVSKKKPVTNDANDSALGAEETKAPAPTQKEKGLKLFSELYTSWHNQLNQAGVSIGNEHYLLSDIDFHKDFYRSYQETYDEPLSTQSWQSLQKEFSNICKFDSKLTRTYKRVALLDDRLIYDHCNSARQVSIIKADGREITDKSPVVFLRTPDMGEQCLPAEKGSIDELDAFLNIDPSEATCIKAAVLKSFIPTLPNPIVGLFGDQGSGKTFALEAIMQIISPASDKGLMSMPTSDSELIDIARHNLSCAFDNVSTISDRQADTFCKISTGIRSQLNLPWVKPGIEFPTVSSLVFLNGINNIFIRPDLTDRAIPVFMKKLDTANRQSLNVLWGRFNEVKPKIIAGIFDGISCYFRKKKKVHLETPPRLMDFAILVTAAEEGLGWENGSFLKAYSAITENAIGESLELNSLAQILIVYMQKYTSVNPAVFTPWKWVDELSDLAKESKLGTSIPTNPKAFSQELFRIKPQFETYGFIIEKTRKTQHRFIKITNLNKPIKSYGESEKQALDRHNLEKRKAESKNN